MTVESDPQDSFYPKKTLLEWAFSRGSPSGSSTTWVPTRCARNSPVSWCKRCFCCCPASHTINESSCHPVVLSFAFPLTLDERSYTLIRKHVLGGRRAEVVPWADIQSQMQNEVSRPIGVRQCK
jgi:hypothetical protein